MARHDQLLKDLFKAFFPDFLAIVAPGVAGELRAEAAVFEDKETFTDMPSGDRNEADLLARVPAAGHSSRLVLTHVELEARRSRRMAKRMWRYYMQLLLRHDLPVLPIVVYVRGGRPDITLEHHEERVGTQRFCEFSFLAFGLSSSAAEQYLERPEPLAWALAALMRPARLRRSQLKLRCLKLIAQSRLSPARTFLLANCVETYIKLEGDERSAYEQLVSHEENREVFQMELTWAEELEARGEARGEARAAQAMRNLLERLLVQRFGELPAEARQRLHALQSIDELSTLSDRILSASTLEETGLLV